MPSTTRLTRTRKVVDLASELSCLSNDDSKLKLYTHLW